LEYTLEQTPDVSYLKVKPDRRRQVLQCSKCDCQEIFYRRLTADTQEAKRRAFERNKAWT